jgi:hypothetical protein
MESEGRHVEGPQCAGKGSLPKGGSDREVKRAYQAEQGAYPIGGAAASHLASRTWQGRFISASKSLPNKPSRLKYAGRYLMWRGRRTLTTGILGGTIGKSDYDIARPLGRSKDT